jgi:hypothetical protein
MRMLRILVAVSVTLLCSKTLAAEELPFDFKVFVKKMVDIKSTDEPVSLIGFRYSKDETELIIYFSDRYKWQFSSCNRISGNRWICTGSYPLQNGATIISQGEKLPPPPPPPSPKPPSPMVKCILPDSSKEEMSAASCQSLGGRPGG